MKKLQVKFKLLEENALVPSRQNETDSGWDLTMIGVKKIVGDVIFFGTGISVQPPEGYYFEIVPRSSISSLPLGLANNVGIIDNGYRGEIIVPIRVFHSQMGEERLSHTTFPSGIIKMNGMSLQSMDAIAKKILEIKPKLCQMILRKAIDFEAVVDENLTETSRGEGGFGSTDSK